jgi:hypothetical protein
MTARQAGLLILVVGVAAALLAAFSDPLNIGRSGWGWKQSVLLGVGIALAVIGAVVALRAPSSDVPPGPDQ